MLDDEERNEIKASKQGTKEKNKADIYIKETNERLHLELESKTNQNDTKHNISMLKNKSNGKETLLNLSEIEYTCKNQCKIDKSTQRIDFYKLCLPISIKS